MTKIYKKGKSWHNSLWIFVCWLIFSGTAIAQTKTITGNVKDAKGDGVPGVAISVKGTPTKGTTTDGNGKFSLGGVDSKTVLRVSSIGFETQEVNVGNKSVVEIT